MNTHNTRPAAHPFLVIVMVLSALAVGLIVGLSLAGDPTPTPTGTPTPVATDICRDAAEELADDSYRMLAEVVVPLMFEDADPTSAEMKDALNSVMADYEATYQDAQRRCNGESNE